MYRVNIDSSVECLTQRRREAESAENARNLANTMNYASNLLEAKDHLKGETTNCWLFKVFCGSALVKTPMVRVLARGLAAASQFALCAHPTRRL